jgi:hypothetical protein
VEEQVGELAPIVAAKATAVQQRRCATMAEAR